MNSLATLVGAQKCLSKMFNVNSWWYCFASITYAPSIRFQSFSQKTGGSPWWQTPVVWKNVTFSPSPNVFIWWFFFFQSWVYSDKHVKAWFLIFSANKIFLNVYYLLLCTSEKKLLMCPHVVKTVSDGFLDTNCCRLTHTRTTRAGEHDFLSPPLWKINTEISLSYTLPRWILQQVLCLYSFIFAVNSSGKGQYESIHFWSAGDPKRLLNTPMLSCQHLQWCSVWAILPSATHSFSPPSPFPSCYISHNHKRVFMPVPNHFPPCPMACV